MDSALNPIKHTAQGRWPEIWLFGNYRANDTYREVAPSHN